MSLASGTQLGPYEVVAPLGAGGMGEVYRARDGRLGRDVAVKVLPEVFETRPDRLARFEREARAAGALSHPNILSVHDVGRHGSRPYVVFELLEGATLRERLELGTRLPLRKCLEVALQAARGLDAAHGKGIVHRDLKPDNLFLTADGVVKILDFGLAKLQGEPEVDGDSGASTRSEAPWHTEAGSLLGTAAYMAPEQVRGRPVDHRCDVFSLGAVLHEMIAGSPAFLRRSRPETLLAILGEDPPDLSRARPGAALAVVSLVRRCLEKDPGDRYQSARDLAFALEGLLSGEDSLEDARRPGAPSPASGRRRRAPRLAALVLLLPLAAAAGWLLRRPAPLIGPGSPRQITSDPGWEAEPALSPDGSFVAYASDRAGSADIWVSDVRGGEPLALTDDPASETSPAWLPDGSAIVFVSDRGGAPALWKVPRLGGSATHLLADALQPAVSPDGLRIAFARAGPSGYLRIAVAPLATPSRAVILSGDEGGLWDHHHPAWSPDGREIAYSDARHLWVVPADGGRARRVTDGPGPDAEPTWSTDSGSLCFSSYREETLALWCQPLGGGRATRLTLGTGPEADPHLAPLGGRLAFSTYHENSDVELIDLRSGRRRRLPGLRMESTPALAPDGREVVYSSDRGGTVDLWSQALVDGRPTGPPRRLTDDPATENMPAVSPDGRWLAFGRVQEGQRDVWVMPLGGGPAVRVAEDPAVEKQPAWSPDGSRLAFVSERGGRGKIWVVPVTDGAPEGEAVRLTSGEEEEYFPSWSPDGSQIAFLRRSHGGYAVWLVGASGAPPPRRLLEKGGVCRWDRASGRLVVARPVEGGVSLDAIDPRTGRPSAPGAGITLPAGAEIVPFDLSADGGLMATHVEEIRGDIWVLDLPPRPGGWR